MKNIILTTINLLLILATASSQEKQVKLDEYITQFKNDLDFVSISVALIRGDEIIWKGAFGKANIERNINATTKHLYALGSVSKLFTGTTLLKLYEEGKLGLDDDVNKYLPFSVRNPKYPDTPITFRMLLTHSSSIGDSSELYISLYVDSDPEMSLSDVTTKFFDPKGEYYRLENYHDYEPGSAWEYSNWNFVLIGYIIERITGRAFNDYCQEVLLKPLEMNTTGWFLREVDEDNIATIYNKRKDGHYPRNNFSWPGYTDGSLRANVEEAANFLIMVLNKGNFKGRQILKLETVAEMLSLQGIKNIPERYPFKDMGLIWFVETDTIYSHTGSPTGSIAVMKLNPETNSGIVCYITGLNNLSPELISKLENYFMYLLQQSATR